jgi:hypothetical protein
LGVPASDGASKPKTCLWPSSKSKINQNLSGNGNGRGRGARGGGEAPLAFRLKNRRASLRTGGPPPQNTSQELAKSTSTENPQGNGSPKWTSNKNPKGNGAPRWTSNENPRGNGHPWRHPQERTMQCIRAHGFGFGVMFNYRV